jgi:hypothetical protein
VAGCIRRKAPLAFAVLNLFWTIAPQSAWTGRSQRALRPEDSSTGSVSAYVPPFPLARSWFLVPGCDKYIAELCMNQDGLLPIFESVDHWCYRPECWSREPSASRPDGKDLLYATVASKASLWMLEGFKQKCGIGAGCACSDTAHAPEATDINEYRSAARLVGLPADINSTAF